LVGMGFDGLSMSPAALPRMESAVHRFTSAPMRSLVAEALVCECPAGIRSLPDAVVVDIGLERILSVAVPHAAKGPCDGCHAVVG